MPTLLENLSIRRVALCSKGANQRAFVSLYKTAEDPPMADELDPKVAESLLAKIAKALGLKGKEEDDVTDAEKIAKQHAEDIAKRDEQIKAQAEEIAKIRDAQERSAFIAKAAPLTLFGKADDFGQILLKISKALTADEFTAFEQKLLSVQKVAQGSDLFKEIGVGGEDEGLDEDGKIKKLADQEVAKAAKEGKTLSAAQAYVAALKTPEGQTLYAARRGRKEK